MSADPAAGAPPAVEAPPTSGGLTQAEAVARLQRYGHNELPPEISRPWISLVAGIVREPMFLLLIATAAIYFALGELIDATVLLVAVSLIISITIYQEQKTERALAALRQLSSPGALVVRDGVPMRIAGREVVPGDLLLVHEGDRIAADGYLQATTNLFVDESLLTGESVPVTKNAAPHSTTAIGQPGGDGLPFVWSGTLVVRGEGRVVVTGTGEATELGRIGKSLAVVDVSRSPLQREVGRAVRLLAVGGIGACVLLGVSYGLTRHTWIDGALAGLTLAVSMVPEEFPVILTIFLALGAWRIARSRVLTRRLPAIETLGATTVLCVDKTGTLTLNSMSVAAVSTDGASRPIDPAQPMSADVIELIATAVRASKPDAVDPMERAFHEFARLAQISAIEETASLAREYPLSEDRLVVTHVWRLSSPQPEYEVAAKGAPEAILSLCGMTASRRVEVERTLRDMADQGMRVLGVARASWNVRELPPTPTSFDFQFLGLVGLADPIRPGVPAAVAQCHSAGIRVAMVTGDYPSTAVAIAGRIGLADPQRFLTGADITLMGDAELRRAAAGVNVFARMVPAQKLRLVAAFKAHGEVVAMTGDGVNDGPALKAADIGVAMGGRGTDVAREAAALVLLDDDFSSIVRAVRLGRRIYDNIRKATGYVLAVHVPIAGISLVPALLGWPLVLLPVHVLFMELVTDPTCSVAFEMEPEEPGIMQRPPRKPGDHLFGVATLVRGGLQGVGAFAAAATVLVVSHVGGRSEIEVRTVTFATLIAVNIALTFANRSTDQPFWKGVPPNPALYGLTAASLGLLAVILSVPAASSLFHVSAPPLRDLVLIAIAATAALGWMEFAKSLVRRATRPV
jgi:Ca2+-transporting ATPase